MTYFNPNFLSGWLILFLCIGCNKKELPKSKVSSIEKGEYLYITSNGIPSHRTGTFPNRYDPIAIEEQDLKFKVPLNPIQLKESMNTNGYKVGIAINGIVFSPNGPFYIHNNQKKAIRNPFQGIESGWQYEGLSEKVNLGHDHNNAHVQPPGLYHYHGVPTLLIEKLKREQSEEMVLLGYAADGYPIYNNSVPTDANNLESSITKIKSSYQLKKGTRSENPSDIPQGPSGEYDGTFIQDYEYLESLSELDMSNGRFGVSREYPEGIYYYIITDNWPYIPRYFKGDPDDSFRLRSK